MIRFIIGIFGLFIQEILNSIWFFIRPMLYLYLVWGGIQIASFFE